MLLTDEKAMHTHVSINVNRLNTFKHILKEGLIHELSVFHVRGSGDLLTLTAAEATVEIKSKHVGGAFSIKSKGGLTKHHHQFFLLSWDASKFLSLFDGLAMLLHENLFASGVEPKVYVARNINPKLVGGEKLQSAMLYMLLS
uniref:Uncharacterized protein n=1 Tax=Brassica campestris TaxID=3711 RepID=M4FD19_BRACM